MSNPVLVLGLGVSGQAVSRLLARQGIPVLAVDAGPERAAFDSLRQEGVEVLAEVENLPERDVVEVAVSPGLDVQSAWVQEMQRRGVPCVSTLEIGWRYRRTAKVLAITGSLGKTTIVTTAVNILQAAGFRAVAAGNIGVPVAEVVMETEPWDWIVAEVSSFQLETMQDFAPDAALVLNIVPNHLDRHGTFEWYATLKKSLLRRTVPGGPALGPSEFGQPIVSLAGTMFDNPVLGQNAAGLLAVLRGIGVGPEAMLAGLAQMKPLPHRLEFVGELDGIRFVNDSKSTCLAATAGALHMVEGAVRLIAGGRPKGTDISELKGALRERVASCYLIGEAAEAMMEAWGESTTCIDCGSLEFALERALSQAQPGDVILLSPGCASFDQFANYQERGNCFRDWVKQAGFTGSKTRPAPK